ncbi:type II secretion system protein [Deefgea sp. CFH1-16]|uniref:type II secretion system protein n=1 Tax=Deefgea sp. CFH1-16 TaxID=2675457 RepID=UPI002495345C|nr:type II secretion system protein [Deefgea sp. CFH1-16]
MRLSTLVRSSSTVPQSKLSDNTKKCLINGLINGFTLIEVLVVMVILSLLTAMVVPNLSKMVGSLEKDAQLDRIRLILSYIPDLAKSKNNDLVLNPDFELSAVQTGEIYSLPDLPENYHLSLEQNISYLANGFCSGGVVVHSK